MPEPKYTIRYTGAQVESAIAKALPLETFEHSSDEVINGQVYHILWKIKPTENNQVSGFTINPISGRLCEVYSDKLVYSLNGYLTERDLISIEELDALFN